MGKMMAGGAIGGLIGAAIWAAIGYFTGYEIGWIAWGLGLLAGLGVRIAGSQEMAYYDREQKKMVTQSVAADGASAGMIAAVAAIGSVLLGKYLVVHLIFTAPSTITELTTDEMMITSMADDIAYERESQGLAVNWPPGMDYESALEKADYPAEIWSEAESQWNAMPEPEKESLRQTNAELYGAFIETVEGAEGEVFKASFGAFDLLWLGLAALTAFRVGSGSES